MANVHFHSVDQLLRIPKPKWLIEEIIHQQETGCLWGPPNCGKSFIALDWALCIATGTKWLGRYRVLQAPVVYMAGEGAASLQTRVIAWMDYHRIDAVDAAYFQIRPLPLREEETVEAIQEALANFSLGDDEPGLNPGFIVVDTVSQFFGGGDENGPDMALFVGNIRRLSHEQDLTVLMVHHSNAGGLRERGHSALRGNVDAMFQAKPHDPVNILEGLSIITDKQRDSAKAEGIAIKFELVDESLVPLYDSVRNKSDRPPITLSRHLRTLLEAFNTLESSKTESCGHSELMEALEIPKVTFHRRLAVLKALKLVSGAGRGKSALTFLGREVLRQEEGE